MDFYGGPRKAWPINKQFRHCLNCLKKGPNLVHIDRSLTLCIFVYVHFRIYGTELVMALPKNTTAKSTIDRTAGR